MIRRSVREAATRQKVIRARSRPAWKVAAMSSGKALLAAVALAVALSGTAAEDLRALQVQGQRGQSLEQARRDRYECHNWAVAQTGESPPAVPATPAADSGKGEIGRAHV